MFVCSHASINSIPGGESEPVNTGKNLLSTKQTSVGPIMIDNKKLLANGNIEGDTVTTSSEGDACKAVVKNTISSTVIDNIVIPNPNSILTQLNDQSNVAANVNSTTESQSNHCKRERSTTNEKNTEVTDSIVPQNTVSIVPLMSSSSATPPTKRFTGTIPTSQNEANHGPKDLSVANLQQTLSSSDSEKLQFSSQAIPKQSKFCFFIV